MIAGFCCQGICSELASCLKSFPGARSLEITTPGGAVKWGVLGCLLAFDSWSNWSNEDSFDPRIFLKRIGLVLTSSHFP